MRSRFVPLAVAALLLAGGCSGDDAAAPPTVPPTTDAQCTASIPDAVFTTLGWTPVDGGAITVRGCRRQAPEGYIEVRRRSASYDTVCATLDRTGTPGPGVPAQWVGEGVTACAVEPGPANGQHVGQTKVVVKESKRQILQIFVAALTATSQAKVRQAVQQLLTANQKG